MTLDDDHAPWVAEALAKGEDPAKVRPIPERAAASRLASIIGKYLTPSWLTTACLEDIASKLVAARPAVRQVLDELDADPGRLKERSTVLKQQREATLGDADFWLEQVAYHRQALEEAEGYLSALGSRYAPKLRDADEVGADEDDRRLSQERRDDAARDQAPRVAS